MTRVACTGDERAPPKPDAGQKIICTFHTTRVNTLTSHHQSQHTHITPPESAHSHHTTGVKTLTSHHFSSKTSCTHSQINMAAQKSLAQDLFEDMGRKVAETSAQEGDDDTRVVDEIESLCMNCHENVCICRGYEGVADCSRAQRDCYSPKYRSSARLS
jgi:hypothetical protein